MSRSALALHEQQQFEFLLGTAVERYVERLMYRCGGAHAALTRLRLGTEAEVGCGEFAEAVLRDFLLDNPAGACFLLQAMSFAAAIEVTPQGTLAEQLQAMAEAAFARLLRSKTEEALERETAFESPEAVAEGGSR